MPATTKDHSNENQNNSSDNGSKSTTAATKAAAEQGLKCPRCDSPNTKFCYYNNYSLTQPRHFCKTCRRYWTKGGALRNVPIGGGCRKNKKGMKPPSSSSSSSSRALSYGDSRDSGGSSDILQLGGLTKLLNGLSNNPLDFNLGGLTTFPASSSSRLQQFQLPIATGFYDYSNNNNSHNNQFCSFGDGSAASSSSGGFQLEPCSVVGGSSSSNLIGLNFPSAFPSASSSSSSSSGMFGSALQQGLNSLNFHTSTLASSIESLSSLNQDLHWKLQQQRLGMLYGGDNNQNQKENNNINNNVLFSAVNNNTNNNNNNVISTLENQGVVVQRPQPILFQSLEISKAVPSSSEIDTSTSTTTAPTEWFFGNNNSYGSAVAPTPITPTPTSTSSGGNNGGRSNNWVGVGGVHAWGDVQQPYTALP